MWVITTLVLLLGGLIGASNIVIAKRPDAKEMIDKLIPFQGIIGIVLLLWGVVGVFDVLRTLRWMNVAPFWWLVFVATVVIELGLGFLLAYGLIGKFAGGQATERIHAKIAGYQSNLGLAAIGLAVLFFLLTVTRGW